MRSGGPLTRGTPLRAVSAKRKRERPSGGVDPVLRQRVFDRDGGCLGRYLLDGRCWGEPAPHHVWRKGQGGPDRLENLVTLCQLHHGWVHGHINDSRALGLLASAHDGKPGVEAAIMLRHSHGVPLHDTPDPYTGEV